MPVSTEFDKKPTRQTAGPQAVSGPDVGKGHSDPHLTSCPKEVTHPAGMTRLCPTFTRGAPRRLLRRWIAVTDVP